MDHLNYAWSDAATPEYAECIDCPAPRRYRPRTLRRHARVIARRVGRFCRRTGAFFTAEPAVIAFCMGLVIAGFGAGLYFSSFIGG